MNKRKIKKTGMAIFAIILFSLVSLGFAGNNENEKIMADNNISYEINNIPEYNGEIYVEINNNIPKFGENDLNIEEDYYSNLENGKVRNGND